MKEPPPFPPGEWVILGRNEVLRSGDLWWNKEYEYKWKGHGFYPGKTPLDYDEDFTWIRQVAPSALQEKEWLNPWDKSVS